MISILRKFIACLLGCRRRDHRDFDKRVRSGAAVIPDYHKTMSSLPRLAVSVVDLRNEVVDPWIRVEARNPALILYRLMKDIVEDGGVLNSRLSQLPDCQLKKELRALDGRL